MLRIPRNWRLAAAVAATLAVAQPAAALTTLFGPGGTVGAAVPDAAVLNGLDAFTTFGGPNGASDLLGGTSNVGQTLFFAAGAFYVGFANGLNPPSAESGLPASVGNNRAYGVIGTGRSDVTFALGSVSVLTLQLRGTQDGASTGGSPAVNAELGPNAPLADAAATLLVYTDQGLQVTQSVSNDDFQTLTIDVTALTGDSITRISLINQGPANSAIVLGELTAVPEPAVMALLGTGLLGVFLRRR